MSGFCKSSHIFLNPRLLLAALHFNENFDREQAKTREGVERLCIAHPKGKQKKGDFTPKPIPVPKTYS